MDRQIFFSRVRSAARLKLPRLDPSQVQGFEAVLDEAERRGTPLRHLAYILATDRHEVGGTMQPVREGFAKTDAGARKAVANLAVKRGPKSAVARYAKPAGPYNHVYYGRGLVQLTWLSNYERATRELGHDFVQFPDDAMQVKWAVQIMFQGMEEGWFTKKKLSDFSSYNSMRAIINGSDKAALIAGYASDFDDALQAAGYEAKPTPKPFVFEKPRVIKMTEPLVLAPAPTPAAKTNWLGDLIAAILKSFTGKRK